jgi:4-amino-4-deoxy-L-arabinose transferase-like glycosyltransferase
VPDMLGEPRVKKPPLVAWITALTLDQQTLDRLDHPQLREQAYVDLAWQVRWTGLLAGCVTIVATFFLGRALFDSRVGLAACMIVGTTILFQKYMRQSTSDVHLAMWVTIANACLASAIMRGRVWSGFLGAGIATAFAFLCKGPVALLETALPALALVLALPVLRDKKEREEAARPHRTAAILVLTVIFAVIALPWFVYVYATVPSVAGTWTTEVSRQGATGLGPDPVYAYLARIPMNWPWIVGLIVGTVVMLRTRSISDWYTLLMFLLPIAVMTLVPDRKERYLLPFVAPAAIIAARGMLEFIKGGRAERVLRCVHWVALLGVCIGFPIAAATSDQITRVDGTNWYPLGLAIWFAVAITALVALGVLLQRRWSHAIIVTTCVCVLAMQALLMWGYKDSPSGRSSLKLLADAIREDAPGAAVFDWDENVRVDEELAIYLNRVIIRADPATLTPVDSPLVYVTRQDRREAEPTPVTGWRFLARVPDRKNQWWAFVKHPSPAP